MEIQMAWRNVWRNPKRTVLTILAIAFACILLVFMLSLQFGTYETMINSAVKTRTGHLQILIDGYDTDRKMRKVISHPDPIRKILNETPGISGYTFRANGFALLSSDHRTYGGIVTGIDPDQELLVSSGGSTIRKGDYLTSSDTNMAIIGSLLARNLKVDIGDELVMLGSAKDGSVAATVLIIKGIFSSGMDEYDRSAIQIPLSYFKEVFAMGEAVHQGVIICDTLGSVKFVQREISQKLPAPKGNKKLVCRSWDELIPGLMQSIQMDLGGGIIFYAILIIVVAFSIMNTFVIAVFERTHELGTLIAIGAKPGRLTKMLLYESAFLTACGIAAGILAGSILTIYAQYSGIPLGDAEGMLRQYGIPGLIRPKLSLISALAGPCIVFIITLISALYPAVMVHKLNPVEAMRTP